MALKASSLSDSLVSKYKQRVLLLGASVGKDWDFPGWPKRTNKDNYIFEMIPFYYFDKTPDLEEIFMRSQRHDFVVS